MNDDWERADRLAQADKHLNRAYELEGRNEQSDALLDCQQAVEVGRAFLAEAYNLQGILLEGLGRQQEALESYQAAVELLPGFQDAADNLAGLQEEMGLTQDVVTLVRFGTGWEAEIARGQLQANGIPAIVADESAFTALGASEGIRLQVRASDLARARQVLDLPETDAIERPAFCTHCGQPIDPDDETCPSCGLDICPDCGTALQEDDVVCPACGAEFFFACPQCGRDVPAGSDACPHCGAEFEYDDTE